MIAYNTTGLDNMVLQEETAVALKKKAIGQEEYTQIISRYPTGCYTPNIFIRIGLFVLTVIIALFSLGLLALMTGVDSSGGIAALFIFGGIAAGAALEFIIHRQDHFRSGVDDALLWMTMTFTTTGIALAIDTNSAAAVCRIVFLLTLAGALRYVDRGMALTAFASLLGIVFYVGMEWGGFGRTILPFLIMAVSIACYILCKTLSAKERHRHHRSGLTVVVAATLLSFYAAGNYFVVQQFSINLLDHSAAIPLPLGVLFWILTVAVPLLYIVRGLQKKDVIFLWTGLALVTAAVFTIRYYHSILPLEWALVAGGAILILLSYALIKYLRTPRYGFTAEEDDDNHGVLNLTIESLVIAETFHAQGQSTAPNDFQFGGGSGGGGGAGGQF